MINEEIYSIDEIVYAIFYSPYEPTIFFPCKGYVKDIKFNYGNPEYEIKPFKFYDDLNFLKTYLSNLKFRYINNGKTGKREYKYIPNFFKLKNTNTIEEFNKIIENEINFTIMVSSINVFKTKKEMIDVFNKLQYFFISTNIHYLSIHLSRKLYNGKDKMSKNKFFNKMEEFFKEFYDDKSELKKYINKLRKSVLPVSLRYFEPYAKKIKYRRRFYMAYKK